jgi:hypothetical protein
VIAMGLIVCATWDGEVDAHAVLRRGPVVDNIEDFVRESCASKLVIGEPKVDLAQSTSRLENVQNLVDQMVEEMGIDVVVVMGKVVYVLRHLAESPVLCQSSPTVTRIPAIMTHESVKRIEPCINRGETHECRTNN